MSLMRKCIARIQSLTLILLKRLISEIIWLHQLILCAYMDSELFLHRNNFLVLVSFQVFDNLIQMLS